MKRMTIAALLAGCLVAGTPVRAEDDYAAPSQALLRMTPADFEKSATLKDDALELVATITTEPGYQERHGLLRIVWSDAFLRAFVVKSTGAVSYQLYQKILYGGRYYRYYDAVNYETPAGPKAIEPYNIGRQEQCSRSQLTPGCVRIEILGVSIDSALLKTVAASYSPGADNGWHFRFKAQTGEDYNGVIMPAEAAGLLAKVADYRREHGLKGD